jgi:uncharacterized protein (TIGR02145 family)
LDSPSPNIGIGETVMNLRRHFFRPFTTIAAGLLALVACQNATDSNSNNDKPVVVTASFPIAAPRIPDSASWIFQKDTTVKIPNCPPVGSDGTTICTETFDLPRPLGTDSVALQLWTLGIQTYTLYFKESGSSTTLDYGSHSVVSLDTLLLSLYANLTSTQKATLAPSDSGRSGLVAYYASLILTGDTAFAGKPLPVGMSADSVKKDLVLQGIAGGRTSAQLTTLNVGLDTASIRNIAAILVQANLLKNTDTLDWFHPVRVNGAASVSGILTAGGSAVRMTGSFAWNTGVQVSLSRISVRTTNPKDSSNVQLSYQFNPGKTDTVWSLSGNLTLQATASAAVGWDTLVVTLSTDPTHSATLRVPFQVVASTPILPPKIVRGSPTEDSTVSWGTQLVALSWTITTDTTLTQVTLNGTPLTSTSTSYQASASLSVGTNTFRLLAVDGRGNLAWDSLHIIRQADSIPPTLKISSPSKDTTVPNATSFVVVSAVASDSGSGIASVQIGNRPKRMTAPFSDTIYLAAGIDTMVVQAWDNAGNHTADTIHVTRTPPMVVIAPPKLQRVSPSVDTIVGWDTKTISISWTVTDDSSFMASVNGAGLSSKTPLYQTTQNLSTGLNTFVFLALDAHGTATYDTIRVTRQTTNPAPVVVRSSPVQDTVILKSQASLNASWSVTDPTLQSVTINGSPAAPSSSVYSGMVSFSGDNRDSLWITMVATDSSGTATRDSIKLWRLAAPAITAGNQSLNPSQTPLVAITSNLPGVRMGYSTDRIHWLPYPSGGLSVSQNEILYAQDTLGSAVSAIDSSIFLYIPSITLSSGGSPTQQTVTIIPTGASGIQDSLSIGGGWNSYTGAFPISGNANIKVFARSILGGVSTIAQEADFALAPTLVASSNDTGVSSVNVTITSPGADAIQTSTDQTNWATLTGSSYPMVTGTLYARAKVGSAVSATSSIVVQLYLAAPTFSSPAGAYPVPQSITLSSKPSGASIYYTTDNSVPSPTNGSLYSGPVIVGANKSLKVIAISAGFANSLVTSASYAIADTTGGYNPKVSYGLVTDASGNLYRTVAIGTQTWMAQDLINPAFGTKQFGWAETMKLPDSCDYSSLCPVDSAVNTQGACPTGYHVPADSSWDTLIQFAANLGNPALAHLSAATWINYSSSYNYNMIGDNSLGFSIQIQTNTGGQGYGLNYAEYWTSSQLSSTTVNYIFVESHSSSTGFTVRSTTNEDGMALRCLHN